MVWEKLGRIYEPGRLGGSLKTHASNPVALHLSGNVFRIYFSGRDHQQRSSVGFFDFDIAERLILNECANAVFTFGPTSSFYSHGVSIGCWYEVEGVRYIPFMGWHIPNGGHWRGEIGRLRIADDLTLRLDPCRPLLGLDDHDPVSLSYPWVMRDSDQEYRMWYGSTVTWDGGNGEMVHIIRQAISRDGAHWTRLEADLPWSLGSAQAFSRPTVIRAADGGAHMWFSYRCGSGKSYRIGYAELSGEGRWKLRLDQSGIDVSSQGWDSEMIEYPYVFEHSGTRYMLYNGNGYGRSGIGLAKMPA